MKKVILDTNAVMAIAEFRIDIFAELEKILDVPYQLGVLEGTLKELEQIVQKQRLRFKKAARLGLALLKAKKVQILPREAQVDAVLSDYSRRGALVLTQDRELKKRLSKPYLTIRQKKRVVMVS